MSLFNFSGGGDIWSSAGFAFVSPINDILDKESFTLEEILAQDEVLQEVKSLNIKLVDFLSKESSIREMIAYLAEPPPEGAPDNRVFKFPYMSCEIICCEVPEILSAVARDGGGAGGDDCPLRKLFSLLEQEGDIDAHRAGYLEKVLTVLLKHRCGATTSFVNEAGVELFRKMVRHLGNFSVMQVAKLLLLPKYAALQDIDATALMGDGRGVTGNEDGGGPGSLWCNWSDDPEILKILLAQFKGGGGGGGGGGDTEPGGGGAGGHDDGTKEAGEGGQDGDGDGDGDGGESADVHLHLSELLLALIAQSSPESSFLKRMFSKEAVDPLVAAATLTKEQGRQADGSQEALQILAALADRLVRPLPPSTSPLMHGETTEMQVDQPEGFGTAQDGVEGGEGGGSGSGGPGQLKFLKVEGDVLERGLRELVPSLCAYLRGHTEDPSTITAQTRQEQPRMGSLRLQVVRFLETLVGMDNPSMDQILIQEHAMATCLEMMFTYETSSMLHTSVAASVLAILIPATTVAGAGARRGSASSPGEAAAAAEAASGEGGEAEGAASAAGTDSAGEGEGGAGGGKAGGGGGGGGRREPFQRHLFEDCRLVERILEAVALNEDAEKPQQEPAPMVPDSGAEPAVTAPAPAGDAAGDSGGSVAEGATVDVGDVGSADGAGAAAAPAASSAPSVPEEGGMAATEVADTAAAAAAAATAAPESQEVKAGPPGEEGESGPAEGISPGGNAATGGDASAAAAGSSGVGEGVRRRAKPGRRLGHMGHVLLLSRAVMGAESGEHGGGGVSSASPWGPPPGAGAMMDDTEGTEGGEGGGAGSGSEGEQGGGESAVDGAGTGASAATAGSSRKSFVAGLLARRECAEHWHEFVNTTLAEEVSRQMNPLGGFTVPSRADENQLSSDFPDEAVDMDDTTGLLENISRMQAAAGGGGGGAEDGGGLPPAPKGSFLDDEDDDDDEFGSAGDFGSAAGGGGGALNATDDNNNGMSMMFGNVNFASSAGVGGGGSAWGSLTGEPGSAAGDSSSSVTEGWANFADFGDVQQQSGGAAGASGAGTGGFANFDPVFAIDAPAPPGPSGFAPSPPSWAPRVGDTGGTAGTTAGGGSGAGSAESGGGDGGGGGGGFADFPQYGGFADFSAMMDDTVASPPAPPPAASLQAFGVADSSSGSGSGGGGDGSPDDDRMDEEGEDVAEERPGASSLSAAGSGPAAAGGEVGLLLGTPGREDKCDSLDAMMGSDDEEEKEAEGGAGGGVDSVSP
eukprot:g6684.t1